MRGTFSSATLFLLLLLFVSGCAGSRSYGPAIQAQLHARTIAAKDVTRPAEHEALLHAEAVLAYHNGDFTVLTGESALRKMKKDYPKNWPQLVRVIQIDGSTKKEIEAEKMRLREFVNRIQCRSG